MLRTAAILGLCITLAGCSEPLTYSKDAQRDGQKMYDSGDYANAAGAFRESVRQQPQNYKGWYYLGLSDLQLKQYQDGIVAFRTARGLIGKSLDGKHDTDTHDKILLGLATAIAQSDQRDIETDTIQKEATDYSSGEAYYILAEIFALRNDPDSALDAFNKASLIDSSSFPISKGYGLYLEKLHMNDKAEMMLRRAYAIDPTDADVNQALRRLGVVPGPSLKSEDQLAKPILPTGPIPNLLDRSSKSTPAAPRD